MAKRMFVKCKEIRRILVIIMALLMISPTIIAGNAESGPTASPIAVHGPIYNLSINGLYIGPEMLEELLFQEIRERSLYHLHLRHVFETDTIVVKETEPIAEEIAIEVLEVAVEAESEVAIAYDANHVAETAVPPLVEAPPPPTYTKWSNVNIVTNDNVSQELVDRANDQLALIPGHLLAAFSASNWTFSVTSRCIDRLFFGGRHGLVAGGINFSTQQILIQDGEWAVTSATIHEFGHWVDNHRGFVSQGEEFLAIYHAEGNAFFNAINYPHHNRNTFELFAEAFRVYIVNPHLLHHAAPTLYWYIHSMVWN